MTQQSCYACTEPESSREHVPPLCLFPKPADSDEDHRRNLITVPSCDRHNTLKSGDDEYLRWVLATNVCANSIGHSQATSSVTRSFKRRPALGSSIVSSLQPADVRDSDTGETHDVFSASLDHERMQRALELVCYGVYHHHHNARFAGPVRVHADFVGYENPEQGVDEARVLLLNASRALFASADKIGESPGVFWYQIIAPAGPLDGMVRLAFYGNCTVTGFLGHMPANPALQADRPTAGG